METDSVTSSCEHYEPVIRVGPPLDACADCLEIGGSWVHLRQCLACGRTSCCNQSPNRHATAHAHATSHPIIRSLEPGEEWSWCYVDEVAFLVDGIRGTTRIE